VSWCLCGKKKLDADEGLLTESHRIAGFLILDVSNFQNVYKLIGLNVLTEFIKPFELFEHFKPLKQF
jgi:hypothetical protein